MSNGSNEAFGNACLYRVVTSRIAPSRGPSWASARRVFRPCSFNSRRSHAAPLVNRRAIREPRPTKVDVADDYETHSPYSSGFNR